MPRDVQTLPGRPPLLPIYDDMKETARNTTPVIDHQDGIASGLPGDRHGRLTDPDPYKGMGLSKNPHPKISPQTMPATIYQPFSGSETKTGQTSQDSRYQARHSEPLRKLVKR